MTLKTKSISLVPHIVFPPKKPSNLLLPPPPPFQLNLSMIRSLHSTQREQEVDDAMKLKALKSEGGARALALDDFFAERLSMAESAMQIQESERSQALRAQEAQVRKLLRDLATDAKARVERQMEKAAELEDEQLRRTSEATLALAQVIGVEDWEGIYKDRFMTPLVSEVQAVEKGMAIGKGGKKLGKKKREAGRTTRMRQLRAAYGGRV